MQRPKLVPSWRKCSNPDVNALTAAKLAIRVAGWFAIGIAIQACDSSKVDKITSGGGCEANASANTVGRCPNGISVCDVGFVDHDGASANGCEAGLDATRDYDLFRIADGGVALFTMNDYGLGNDVIGGWCAIRGPECQATPASPCTYDLLALQVRISDFVFDGVAWTDGVFALPRSIVAVDQGDGLVVPAGSDVVGTFMVGGQKRVVSLGTTIHGIAVQVEDGRGTETTTGDLTLSFGGYTMEVHVAARGDLAATGYDAGALD
jgi:hypothetical protein